jgi:hypothetical protein
MKKELRGWISGSPLGCGVALWIFLSPRPSRLNDFLERGMGSFPAEGALELFFAGNQNRGITGAARA